MNPATETKSVIRDGLVQTIACRRTLLEYWESQAKAFPEAPTPEDIQAFEEAVSKASGCVQELDKALDALERFDRQKAANVVSVNSPDLKTVAEALSALGSTPAEDETPTAFLDCQVSPWYAHADAGKLCQKSCIDPFSRSTYVKWLQNPRSAPPRTPRRVIADAEKSAEDFALPNSTAIYWLEKACRGCIDSAEWLERNKKICSSWNDLKEKFLASIHNVVPLNRRYALIGEIRISASETLVEYRRRFIELISALGFESNSTLVCSNLRRSLPFELSIKFQTICPLNTNAWDMLTLLIDQQQELNIPEYPAKADYWLQVEHASPLPPVSSKQSTHKSTGHHQKSHGKSHVVGAVASSQSRNSNTPTNSSFSRSGANKSPPATGLSTSSSPANSQLYPKHEPLCAFCKTPGHHIVDCPDPKCRRSKNYVKMFSAEPDDGAEEATDKPKFVATLEAHARSDKDSIEVPLTVHGQLLSAMIDTGAQVSILRADLLPKGTKLSKPDILKSIDGRTLKNLGITAPLVTSLGNRTITHCFRVVNYEGPAVVFGYDLWTRFGLSIDFPMLELTEFHSMDTQDCQEFCDASKSEVMDLPIPESERTIIVSSIENHLKKNLETQGKFCTLPESIVHLPLKEGVKPVFTKQFRLPPEVMTKVLEKADSWLLSGIIEMAPPGIEWNCPLLAVPKSCGGVRVCHDFRGLNSRILDDGFPLPPTREVIEQLASSRYFSCLDLRESFNQFLIAEEDRHKTAFMVGDKQFICVAAPFGLKTLTAIFQRVIRRLFSSMPFVASFVDDIIVHSQSLEEHCEHLNQVISTLTLHSLTLNPEKCKWGYHIVRALGRRVSSEGISVDLSKLSELESIPFPVTPTQARSFLGLANYFREHVPNFASISRPLDLLRNTGLTGEPSEEQLQAFENLKKALLHAPFLHFPKPDLPFTVWTDASNTGLGAMLTQEIAPSQHVPILFASRALSKSESNYSVSKRELLGIIFALVKFEYYLHGRRFRLFTDHKALTYFQNQKTLSPLLWGWIEKLSSFDMELAYCPGKDNILADYLSRLYQGHDHSINAVAALPQSDDDSSSPEADEPTAEAQVLSLAHTVLIQQAHELGHHGVTHIVQQIRSWGHSWETMASDARRYVAECPVCLSTNPVKAVPHGIWDSISADAPMDRVCVDLVTMKRDPSGAKYLLIAVDVASRFVILRPLLDKTAISVGVALAQIFADFGPPRIIHSDGGREFTASVITSMMEGLGVRQHFTTPYHPQSNGIAERFVRSTLTQLRRTATGWNEWVSRLPAAQLALNSLRRANKTYSAFEIVFARGCPAWEFVFADTTSIPTDEQLETFVSDRKNLLLPLAHAEQQSADHTRKEAHPLPLEIAVGSHVWIRNASALDKSKPVFIGPFIVQARTSNGMYRLADTDGVELHRLVHRTHLKVQPQA